MLAKFMRSGLVWLGLTLVVVILDQWTKVWAVSALSGGRIIEVMPHFDFRLAYNYGAAFSFLADAGGWQRYFLAGIAVAISLWIIYELARSKASQKWHGFAYAMILSGAIGNVYDRVTLGYVVDFIDWYWEKSGYHWPAFNIADSAIFIGAVMLIIDALFFHKKREAQKQQAEA
ncbi:MAG: signal peptidase II [Gammaproteobacteria bacterium]|nr:signal peptidase II [Gammaproteobacteria bacterium]